MIAKNKRVLIAVAGAAVLGAYGYLSQKGETQSQNKAVISSHYQASGSFADYPWQTGMSYEYSLDLTEEGTFQFNLLAQEGQAETQLPYSAKLSGSKAELSLLEKDDEGYLALFQLKPQAFQLTLGQDSDSLVVSTREDLEQPVLLKFKTNGMVEWLQFADGVDVIARNMLRQLISDAFPVLAEGNVQIPSLQGDRTYRQVLDRSGVNANLERTLVGLKPTHGQKIKAESRLIHVLGPDHSLLHSEWDGELVSFGATDKTVLSKTVSSGRLDFVARMMKKPDHDWRSIKWKARAGMDGSDEFEQALHNYYVKLVKDTTLDQQIEAFRALGHDKTIYDAPETFNKIFAFMKIDPQSIPRVAELLNEFDSRDHRFDMIAVLLAQEASALSQKLLLDYTQKFWNDPEKVNQLLFNAALVESPLPEMVEGIQRMVEDTAPTDPNFKHVLFNSAGVAYHSSEENFKAAIAQHIQQQISNKTVAEHSGVLAMSNLGSRQTYAFAQTYLADKDAERRKLGATALRRVAGEHAADATQSLITLMAHDSSDLVRREASLHLISRTIEPGQLAELEKRLYQETDETTLIQLLEAIRAYSDQTAARSVLIRYNRSCGNPKVCSKVESLLIN